MTQILKRGRGRPKLTPQQKALRTMQKTTVNRWETFKRFPLWSWFATDKPGLGLHQLVTVDTRGDYSDTSRIAQLRAVLNVLPWVKRFAAILVMIGLVLTLATAAVSVTHVWEVVASIKPDNVAELVLSDDTLHRAALAFTVTFDVALIYLLFVGMLSSFTKVPKPNINLLTLCIGALNALYVFKYFPALNIVFQGFFVIGLTHIAAILIPIVFILTLIKVKGGIEYCTSAFIALSIQIETYNDVLKIALESLRTQSDFSENSLPNDKLIKYLFDSGVPITKIAKIMGGNYQNRVNQIKNTLELPQIAADVTGNSGD